MYDYLVLNWNFVVSTCFELWRQQDLGPPLQQKSPNVVNPMPPYATYHLGMVYTTHLWSGMVYHWVYHICFGHT